MTTSSNGRGLAAALFMAIVPCAKAELFTLTGGLNPLVEIPQLVRFGEDTLQVDAGRVAGQAGGKNDVAADETGRVFAVSNLRLLEFDPVTLEIVNVAQHSGSLAGIAVRNGKIFTLTGHAINNLELVVFDANSFAQVGGPSVQSSLGGGNDLAFDENGRLFGISNDWMLEFDPVTFAIINERQKPGLHLSGIAVREGTIYSLTGADVPALVSFDADTLELRDGVVQDESSGRNDVAFDADGRLFAIGERAMMEFDPVTLQIIKRESFVGTSNGLAASTPRPPAESIRPIASAMLTPQGLRIAIPSAFRRTIGIEYAAELTSGEWTDLGNFFQPQSGDDAVFIDPDFIRLGRSQGFYRAFLRPLLRSPSP